MARDESLLSFLEVFGREKSEGLDRLGGVVRWKAGELAATDGVEASALMHFPVGVHDRIVGIFSHPMSSNVMYAHVVAGIRWVLPGVDHVHLFADASLDLHEVLNTLTIQLCPVVRDAQGRLAELVCYSGIQIAVVLA